MAITPVDIPTWVEQGPGPIQGGQVEGLATPNVAGAVEAVAAGGGHRMYLGTADSGIWSTDNVEAAGGPVWTSRTDSLQSLATSTLTVVAGASQDTVYAGTGKVSSGPFGDGGVGVYRSTDSGQTWATLGEADFNRLRVTSVQVTPVG